MKKFKNNDIVRLISRNEKLSIVAYRPSDDNLGGTYADYGQYLCDYVDATDQSEIGSIWIDEPDMVACGNG